MKNRIEISLLFIFLSTLFTARGQYTTFDAVVSEPGTLKVAIGDRWNAIDSLVVNGPINAEDFNIIYQSIRYGRVDVLNLEKAQLENNELPNVAFCKDDSYRLYIRRIMLPDNIVRFDRAALYKTEIESINIPSSLQEIGELAFGYSYLGIPKLILPEGITQIPHSCFFQTQGIEEVVLPSSVKTIDIYGFAQNTIREVNIPEGVDSIGGWAFNYSLKEEITIPSTCTRIGMYAISCCKNLKEINVLSNITTIPQGFAYLNPQLERVTLPQTVVKLEDDALGICESLTSIELPHKLEWIGKRAFQLCALDSIFLPASLQYIDDDAFNGCTSMQKIYCPAQTPPTCKERVFVGIAQNIPVSIPVGTLDIYQNTAGWKHFTNFIEIDNFPGAVTDVRKDTTAIESRVYWSNSYLVIEIEGAQNSPVEYNIYTLDGRLVEQGCTTQSYLTLPITQGTYIVCVANKIHKVL